MSTVYNINKIQCLICKGSGYELHKPVRCSCSSMCYKCEKKGGLLVHFYETCVICDGLGTLEK